MKTISIATMLILFISCSASSKSNSFTGSLLWEVSGNGLEHSSYIFGTHHLTSIDINEINGLSKAMDEAEQIYGELKIKDSEGMQLQMMHESQMPDGVTYEGILSEEDYETLNTQLKSILGVGLATLGEYKPAMISSMLSLAIYSKAVEGFSSFSHEAIDIAIQRMAAEEGKECFGLETIEDQLAALFDSEPLEAQAERLVCTVKNMDSGIESVLKLNELYASGALDKMYDLAFNTPDNPCQYSEEFSSALNKERNDKWLEKLPNIFSQKPTLVAVGALHLAGEDGLLFKLSQMGYEVKAVK